MRTFSFKARNVGDEKYLTYTMGEECELDEDVLDYCEEHALDELISIIYEEDEDYDYLTYDITGKTSLGELITDEMKAGQVMPIIKNIAAALVSMKEQAIPLAYILFNRNFVYVDKNSGRVSFICLPIESDAAVVAEFKGFMRQLLANMKYDIAEDLSYVGKLLTYINGDTFNLRGLIGLVEAMMDDFGIAYESSASIDADGVEVVNTAEEVQKTNEQNVSDFMKNADSEKLPEIGDDEEENESTEPVDAGEELESILPAGMPETAPEVATQPEEALKAVAPKSTDVDVVAERVRKIMGDANGHTNELAADPNATTPMASIKKKNVVKVNRAAIIQSVAAEQEEEAAAASQGEEETTGTTEEMKTDAPSEAVAEEITQSKSILNKTIAEPPKPSILNAPKAVPYLVRVNTNERIMLNKPVFKIGKASRGVDYTVDGNGAISRVHAIITQRDDVCYIKDNKSTNHTYVNNQMVEEGTEEILTHDSLVRLGDEEFTFKIR